MTSRSPYLCAHGVVLKVGGNVLMPRGTDRPDTTVVDGVAAFIRHAQEGRARKVVVVPGGFAGQIVIEWARELGAADLLLNDLGCTLIDAAARILTDALSRKLSLDGITVSASVARSFEQLTESTRESAVTVSGVLGPGGLTSDSLAIMIAGALNWPVVLVKQRTPFRELLPDDMSPEVLRSIKASDVLEVVLQEYQEMRPGNHPSLDLWALQMLRRDRQNAYLTTREGMVALSDSRTLEPLIAVEGD
jgi:uridylate kinase